jgi:hypothetical protein
MWQAAPVRRYPSFGGFAPITPGCSSLNSGRTRDLLFSSLVEHKEVLPQWSENGRKPAWRLALRWQTASVVGPTLAARVLPPCGARRAADQVNKTITKRCQSVNTASTKR